MNKTWIIGVFGLTGVILILLQLTNFWKWNFILISCIIAGEYFLAWMFVLLKKKEKEGLKKYKKARMIVWFSIGLIWGLIGVIKSRFFGGDFFLNEIAPILEILNLEHLATIPVTKQLIRFFVVLIAFSVGFFGSIKLGFKTKSTRKQIKLRFKKIALTLSILLVLFSVFTFLNGEAVGIENIVAKISLLFISLILFAIFKFQKL